MAFWDKLNSRGNVEDRRGFASRVGGISLTGVAILLILNTLSGGDPLEMLGQLNNVPIQTGSEISDNSDFEGEDDYQIFASTVLGSNNEMWIKKLKERGLVYTEPKLVLFRTSTTSACGIATSEVGPHYCPLDETIYLDETFFDELTSRFGARGGDVAEAYVISHEVAHHAQNKLNLLNSSINGDSIATELQADCFAGLWANSIKDLEVFEDGEIVEAMDAAAAVGDDRVQTSLSGMISPENWTHGSSAQRQEWFTKGYEEGKLEICNFPI